MAKRAAWLHDQASDYPHYKQSVAPQATDFNVCHAIYSGATDKPLLSVQLVMVLGLPSRHERCP